MRLLDCGFAALLIVIQSSAFTPLLFAQSPPSPEQFADVLEPLAKAHAGEVAISVRILDEQGQETCHWSYRGDVVMPTASLIKLPVMVEAYRQAESDDAGVVRLSLDRMLVLKEEDKVPGSGVLTDHFTAGMSLSVRDAIRLMIRYSDNTATNMVVDCIGIESTAKTMSKLGFPETQLHSKVFRRDSSVAPDRSERFGLGSTTANDMTELLARLDRGEIVSPAAAKAMLSHLLTCDDEAKLTRELPAECRVAHKTGAVNRSRTAAGIVSFPSGKFAICVLTDKNADTSWSVENAAEKLIGRIARTVYDEVKANSPGTRAEIREPTALTLGATGELVESLQRTLNDRIMAGLSVDGDFGPATGNAVKKFQESKQIAASGVMDEATWTALGDLIDTDMPVPPPELVNSQALPSLPALDPHAVPEFSAKAWIAMDSKSQEILAEHNSRDRLHIASTTKVMTAFLVLELAAADPGILDEIVTFSVRADATIGSTSGVRAGEQLPVGKLLYGLLLPSGNDAAVALAEHFGNRLGATTESGSKGTGIAHEPPNQSPYDQFISAMNARARQLGMHDSHFENPHGLTEPAHRSTALDLARLCHVALQLPYMRKVMGCRQYGVQVQNEYGNRRNLLWENTNRLLAQDGFIGMKTGTTDAAGACLIAVGKHPVNGVAGERETIVVILGASSSEARYIDARNLFSWAWRKP